MTADILEGLNSEQKEAVEHEHSPLLILAGAGSGKTRVITTKIAYLIAEKGFDPKSILAVTFTKKAAAEMRERAISLDARAAGAQLRTFHSFGAWFLRLYGTLSEDKGGMHTLSPNFTVYDDDDAASLIAKAVPHIDKNTARSAASCISLAKDYCLSPDDDLADIAGNWDVGELRAIYKAYQARLADTGNADFGDLIMLPALMLERNEQLSKRMQSRFRVVMVDEYQDSNVAQFRLLRALVGDTRQTGVYVCVVGDDDQSIYKFRGAEVSNILRFADVFPNTKTITLFRNYRSTKQILEAADNVVRRNTNRLDKTLTAERGEGEKPCLVLLDDQRAEASFCADMITQNDAHYRDWAILYRSNAQSRAFEVEFLRRKIPYVVVGTLKFYEREEVKDVLAIMALIANGHDEVAFRRVVNKPARGAGGKTVDTIVADARNNGMSLLEAAEKASGGGIAVSKRAAAGLQEFCSIMDEAHLMLLGDGNLGEVVQKIATKSGLADYHRDKEHKRDDEDAKGVERLANINELAASAVPYERSFAGLTSFLDDIALSDAASSAQITGIAQNNGNGQSTGLADAVTLITVHNTKGLEFPHVVITGVEAGIFPHGNEDFEGMEEERRLFYVGVTRAKDTLCITSCAERYIYGRMTNVSPSRFIGEAGDVFTVIDKRYRYSPDAEQAGTLDEFKRGTRVYNDDYGYGYVMRQAVKNGEVIVSVRFESGAIKVFMPQYQQGALVAVED